VLFIQRFFLSYYVLQLLDTGFFHADPHPGNMIRTPDGKLAILDFGKSRVLTNYASQVLM
jgi:predicted unusual protein kinase regulating ubiquinone biosynthesis (AarF/ABC1/UbiB family)